MSDEASAAPPFPPERVERYRNDGLWTRETLGDALRRVAQTHADRPAVITLETRLTYAELDELTDSFAAGLLACTSLRSGDKVMFQLGNEAETVVAYYGCVKAGIIPVCTLPQHGEREIGLLAEHTGARGHLVQEDFRRRNLVGLGLRLQRSGGVLDTLIVARGAAPDAAHSYDTIVETGRSPQARHALAEVEVEVAPEGLVALQLSGGTTGLPKVAPRRHEEYVYNSRAWAESLELTEQSVLIHCLPLMHNAGIAAAIQPAHLVGAACVIAPEGDITVLLELIAKERVTVVPAVPPAVGFRLLEHEQARVTDLSSLQLFVFAGQRPSVEMLERLESELGIRSQQLFGMAEGMFLFTPPDAPAHVRLDTVGAPISPADEVRVLAVADEQEVPDGTLGELACRGPYTINGYYRAEQHNASTFTADGFYRTGDLVTRHVIDDRVYYSVDGRIKDVINRGGEKIYTEELEELLVRHPGVSRAAVVAMPDPVLGERICAYLVPTDGSVELTVATAGEFLLGQGLANYKLPERIEVVDAFPLTNIGKVSKNDLRADIEAKIEHEAVV
jgi:2,3-dihydroxybenzoate-AMP ligase